MFCNADVKLPSTITVRTITIKAASHFFERNPADDCLNMIGRWTGNMSAEPAKILPSLELFPSALQGFSFRK